MFRDRQVATCQIGHASADLPDGLAVDAGHADRSTSSLLSTQALAGVANLAHLAELNPCYELAVIEMVERYR